MVGMKAIVSKLWKMVLQTCVSSCPVQDSITHFQSSAIDAPVTSINDSSSSSSSEAMSVSVMSEQLMSGNGNGMESHSSSNKNLCPICLDPLSVGNGDGSDSGEAIFTSQCSHSFHFTCITSNVRHGSVNCPVCRSYWSQLPRYANIRTDPVLRMIDESIATVRIQRRSALHNDDDPIFQPHPPRLLFSVIHFPDKSPAMMSCCLSVTLNHSPAIDLVLVATPPDGPHLRLIKHSMALAVYSLRPIDRVAIVTNSTAAARVFPLRRMTPYGKQTALQVIDRLFYSQQSDPIEGIRKGMKIIGDRAHKNPKCSILHLSNSSPTRTYQCSDGGDAPVPIHRFHVGYGHGSSNGFVVNEFKEFLSRVVVGGGITETRLNIGDDGRIVEVGEMRSGDEKRIPLKFQEWRKVRVDYSYRVYNDGGGVDDSYITGEVMVDGSHPFEGTSNGCESLGYYDPFRARRWAKHLHGPN